MISRRSGGLVFQIMEKEYDTIFPALAGRKRIEVTHGI